MSEGRRNGGIRHAGDYRLPRAAIMLVLPVAAVLLAACGGGSSGHSSTATQPPVTQPPAASPTTTAPSAVGSSSTAPTVIRATNSRFGPILTDAKGMTLYTATGDTATTSGCTGACLQFWPPLLLPAGQAQPIAGTGVSGLGTFMRAEGVQVTYNGKPLYTWIKDDHPGQVTGEGVVDSGGTWHVATVATGTSPTTTAPAAPAPTVTPAAPAPTMTPASVSPATTVPRAPSGGGASF